MTFQITLLWPLLFIGFLLNTSLYSFADADIATNNTGEKAMIATLRSAIDRSLSLKSMNLSLGAGISGCEGFQNSNYPHRTKILITWQWLDCLRKIPSGTIVIAPEHSVDDRFQQLNNTIQLITISGVLHNKTFSHLEKAPSPVRIDTSTEQIVMLAGDTQQEDGSWLLYNQSMADKLLQKLPYDQKTLILNGPRTGLHAIKTTEPENAYSYAADPITQRAIVIANSHPTWRIFDYHDHKISGWDEALKFCVHHPNVALILPGESTSMICEALSLGILPILYKHPSMTAASLRFIDSLILNHKALAFPNSAAPAYRQTPLPNQVDVIIAKLENFLHQLASNIICFKQSHKP